MPTKTPSSMSASLILSKADADLYKHYQKIQNRYFTLGQISHALEYHLFLQFRAGQANTQTRNRHVISHCGHTVHPTDTSNSDLCPECEVTICLKFLDVITQAWIKEGGPWPDQGIREGKWRYDELRKAWIMTRLELQNALDAFERMAEKERQWERDHPREAERARGQKTGARALKIGREGVKYPFEAGQVGSVEATAPNAASWGIASLLGHMSLTAPSTRGPRKSCMAKQTTKKKKTVAFAAGTDFKPGRSNGHFVRRSPSPTHILGAHSASPGHELRDTSMMRDKHYSMEQQHVWSTTSEKEFLAWNADVRLMPAQHEGPIALHKLCKSIHAWHDEFLSRKSVEGQQQYWKAMLQKDGWVVWTSADGSEVLGVFWCRREDIEAEEKGYWRRSRKGTKWASLKDCGGGAGC